MSDSPRTGRRNRKLQQAIESLETRRLLAAVFTADFEAPLDANWTLEGATSLWHRSNISSQTGTYSLYYGQDVERNYNTGVSSGTVTTPSFSLAGASNATLKFSYLLQVEKLVREDVWVQASADNGSTWTTLASAYPIGSESLLKNDTARWQKWSGSLAGFTTNAVKLRFYFDSGDEIANEGLGFLVDDVEVSTTDAPPFVTDVTPTVDDVISTSSANIQFTFSETVSGVDVTDLVLSGPAAAGASVTGVSGSGTTWTFAVSGLTTGVLTTSLAPDAGDITDTAGQSPTVTVTKFQVILPDAYDVAAANESLATASDLGVVGGERVFSNLTLHSTSDADFYKFTADATGPVTLTLTHDESLWEDVDIYAYGSNQTLIVEPDPEDLDNTITFDVTKGQTYYIKAYSESELVSDGYSLSISAPAEAPRVTNVWVKGSTWNSNYLTFLGANIANGSATYGYAIPTGANQLQTLPWVNLNTVSIQFSEPVNLTKTQLIMIGTSTYNVAGSVFTYNPTDRVGTWQLPANFVADRLYVKLVGSGAGVVEDLAGIDLDGEFTTSVSPFPSGNGSAGGDFIFRFDVLPGDSSASGAVNSTDISQAKLRGGQTINTTNFRTDLNGSNTINSTDISIAKLRAGTLLPPAPSLLQISSELLLSPSGALL